MLAYVRGILYEATPTYAIVEANGLGYKIFIPANVYTALPQIGTEVLLHTSFIVRELSHSLYGFIHSNDREIFEALLGVTGIGPKLALSIIGHMSGSQLDEAISQENISAISRIPGIGKKTAERLIIELRGKLTHLLPPTPGDLVVHLPGDPRTKTVSDAMSALVNLGYNQQIAQKAIKKTLGDLPEIQDLGTLITHALKHI